jgi:hypothetical protein
VGIIVVLKLYEESRPVDILLVRTECCLSILNTSLFFNRVKVIEFVVFNLRHSLSSSFSCFFALCASLPVTKITPVFTVSCWCYRQRRWQGTHPCLLGVVAWRLRVRIATSLTRSNPYGKQQFKALVKLPDSVRSSEHVHMTRVLVPPDLTTRPSSAAQKQHGGHGRQGPDDPMHTRWV